MNSLGRRANGLLLFSPTGKNRRDLHSRETGEFLALLSSSLSQYPTMDNSNEQDGVQDIYPFHLMCALAAVSFTAQLVLRVLDPNQAEQGQHVH